MTIEIKQLSDAFIEAELFNLGWLTPLASYEELCLAVRCQSYEAYEGESEEQAASRRFKGSQAEYVADLLEEERADPGLIVAVYGVQSDWMYDNYWRLHAKYAAVETPPRLVLHTRWREVIMSTTYTIHRTSARHNDKKPPCKGAYPNPDKTSEYKYLIDLSDAQLAQLFFQVGDVIISGCGILESKLPNIEIYDSYRE